jgi:uncharacterized protein with PhoU and TrkA domain
LTEKNRAQFERICNDLVELKDTSEMMMDLAYSALLLNSRELAEEVQMLEDRIDRLHIEFELLVLSTSVETKDSKGLLGLIRLGVVTERIADAAAEIAEVVLRGDKPHPVLSMVIEDANETVERVIIPLDSPLVGKTLKDAQIPEETGMWVLVVRRGERWMQPHPWTTIQPGDVVIASGYAEGEEDLKRLVAGQAILE